MLKHTTGEENTQPSSMLGTIQTPTENASEVATDLSAPRVSATAPVQSAVSVKSNVLGAVLRLPVIVGVIAGVLVGFILGNMIPQFGAWYQYWFFHIIDGKPAWTYWITVLAGLFAGIVALISFVYTHLQRDKHFRDAEFAKQEQFNKAEAAKLAQFTNAELTKQKQFNDAEAAKQDQFLKAQEKAQELANQKEKADRELAEERQRQERFHFERRELQAEFADIQNRFEKENISIRANAAFRLADFACRIDPAKEPATLDAPRPLRNETNNPYFLSVASQLTTALYLEKDDAVRKAISDALSSLTEFAKVKNADDEEPRLLYQLIEKIKDANTAAKARFVEAMAAWAVATHLGRITDQDKIIQRDDETEYSAATRTGGMTGAKDIEFLATVTGFYKEQQITEIVLRYLMSEGEANDDRGVVTKPSFYSTQRSVATARRTGLPTDDARKADDALRLSLLETAAKQLITTRDALALALRALTHPVGFPDKEIDDIISSTYYSSDSTVIQSHIASIRTCILKYHRPELNISHQFLAGANLYSAHLQKANIYQAILQGALLDSAYLQGAFLNKAQLQGADLAFAGLQGANLGESHLQMADLSHAFLLGCSLHGVHFSNESSGVEKTKFPENTLEQAMFPTHHSDKPVDVQTERLKAYLQEQFR